MLTARHPLHEKIIDAIASTGCYVGESILSFDTTTGLRQALMQMCNLNRTAIRLSPNVAQAAIGQRLNLAGIGKSNRLSPAWRGDSIAWLTSTPSNRAEGQAMLAIDALRVAFNAAIFTNMQQTELHYAHYPIGAFYKRHLDRFVEQYPSVAPSETSPSRTRVISLVFYLNDHWALGDGGELIIYDTINQSQLSVAPCTGTMVAFRSEQFPHEVLPAIKARLSLTGWMLAPG